MTRSSKRGQAPVAEGAAKRAKKDEEELVLPVETAASVEAAAAAAIADSKPAAKKRVARGNVGNDQLLQDFNDYLFQLISFKADTGNFHVNKDQQPQLHNFLTHIKKEYKFYTNDKASTALTDEQVKVLEFLHVPLTSRGDDHWSRFYSLLEQYKERHGHVLVPRLCEIPGLGDWVTDQRRQYKAWKQGQSSQLTTERREKLEALGFAWSVRNRPEWEHRFQQLLEYKEKNGYVHHIWFARSAHHTQFLSNESTETARCPSITRRTELSASGSPSRESSTS